MAAMPSITIRDVAREAGVSTATVSYALNNTGRVTAETRERIIAIARRLNYRPNMAARNLQASETRLIAYSWRPSLGGQFHPVLDQFLTSMAQAAAHHGYRLVVYPTETVEEELRSYEELVGERQLDGIVLSSTNFEDQRVKRLLELDFPFVAFGRSRPDLDFPWVDVDGFAGLYASTRHLIEQGHRRIACLSWPQGSLTGDFRLAGFLSAMQDAKLPVPDEFVVHADNYYDAARTAILPLLQLAPAARPTGYVVVSDLMAMGVMNILQESGIVVGEEVAVTGFDDAPVARYLRPPLTSLAQPLDEVGDRLISMLVDVCRNRKPSPSQLLLAPELKVRDTSSFRLSEPNRNS